MTLPEDHEASRMWAGLPLLDRLVENGEALASEEVACIVGARSVKGIGSALRPTGETLVRSGIRLEEAVRRRTVRRRSVWTAGDRIRQARHVLDMERRFFTDPRDGYDPLTADPEADWRGPVVVLRSLRSSGGMFRIDGGMAELDDLLEPGWFDLGLDSDRSQVGEVFVERIEPGKDGTQAAVPDGYGENGIWVRGRYDYAHPQVAGAIGTGRFPMMYVHVREAAWVERRLPLIDAVRQTDAVRLAEGLMGSSRPTAWHGVEPERYFRYVNWISARPEWNARRSAPPIWMRLRCWYDVVIEAPGARPVVLHEEGLRGDEARTAGRAIARWRETRGLGPGHPVQVRQVRISGKQPRPMSPI
ncbi:MAG: hypothetical protein OXN16_10870 [Gammaproteobacteria bacterium]|nr:hypothetical protein [Gammaproteobacteria bacterium]